MLPRSGSRARSESCANFSPGVAARSNGMPGLSNSVDSVDDVDGVDGIDNGAENLTPSEHWLASINDPSN